MAKYLEGVPGSRLDICCSNSERNPVARAFLLFLFLFLALSLLGRTGLLKAESVWAGNLNRGDKSFSFKKKVRFQFGQTKRNRKLSHHKLSMNT